MFFFDAHWDHDKTTDEASALRALVAFADLSPDARKRIVAQAAGWVTQIRTQGKTGLMDTFLAQYGLSTDEGVALMCLAEALLRVPDTITIDVLIEDKIAPSDWSRHIGRSSSPLVNASTWGLLLTGRVLDDTQPGVARTLRALVRRVGEPVIRRAVTAAMREMGRQFVLGQDIAAAMTRGAILEAKGYTYSYDMLGEAAMTAQDAERYAQCYSDAIGAIAAQSRSACIADNPGISVKLSALHPRYEVAQCDRVMVELVPVLRSLCIAAARGGIGLNIDAEEADRLGLSMHVIAEVLKTPDLCGWDGFGVVVQAYGLRAPKVIDGLADMARELDRRIMVRLVKGAYWDTEIKHAQVEGLSGYPVFTRKAATDISYLGCARQLLTHRDVIYPQFATHNAHSVATILEMAQGLPRDCFEFQRLHGMGEALHELVMTQANTRCRIYAPVGTHQDLLAYLVRRLLENGANSSFVNQIVNVDVPVDVVVRCPFETMMALPDATEPAPCDPADLFHPERQNAKGFDLSNIAELVRIEAARSCNPVFDVAPVLAIQSDAEGAGHVARNPATLDVLGPVRFASPGDVSNAFAAARPWNVTAAKRAEVLQTAADRFEADFGTAFSLLTKEAGKTLSDAVSELREAVDFLRYYAAQAEGQVGLPRGIWTCISPWNFPLAIFTGQVAAALATGNAVLAKPAETTPGIASWAITHLLNAGVPRTAVQLLPGTGTEIGQLLVSDPRVAGVAFTGSTATARVIQRSMAAHATPGAPLIAETGGLNAMVVDSTALPEQAVRDIVASAFQSAGQRCSALRCVYLQKDIAPRFINMLVGAMQQLRVGNPWDLSTDLGPVITPAAAKSIQTYVDAARCDGRLVYQSSLAQKGALIGPALIRVDGIESLDSEVFGPVLHVATFEAHEFEDVIAAVNRSGYGLTFGLHSRIDARVQYVAETVEAGNIYANRNQIGAIVGLQPFGGEKLSGTGPKAGGPHYLARFLRSLVPTSGSGSQIGSPVQTLRGDIHVQQTAHTVADHHLPGPTGELNRLTLRARGPVLCLGPGLDAAGRQAAEVEALGGQPWIVLEGFAPERLISLPELAAVVWWGPESYARSYALALASRTDGIVPLLTDCPDVAHVLLERHLCVDTTAAGGNAALLAGG
jgi:RHH-type proline utilization regulon transcriptional repressor/proline dehydrogenase/delta 1-pyrroline-5-carboxylate dehydrogenase